jgi:HSP20 family molecular chaperone IbpA
MDIRHDEKANSVTASFDLPGMQKKDVSIDIHNNILSVSGDTKETTEREEEGYALRERRYGKFSRSLSLPHGTKVGCSINPRR